MYISGLAIDVIKSYLTDCYGWTKDDFEDYKDFSYSDWMAEIKANFSVKELWDFAGKQA